MLAVLVSTAIPAERKWVPAEFAQALETHKAMVYSMLWHFHRDRTWAEEVAQGVFLELYRNWNSLRSPPQVVSWLRRVTAHRAIDQLRERPETTLEETAEPTVLERLHDSFPSSYLQRMLISLPPTQRMIVILRYQEGMELDEVASILSMKTDTAKTQLASAIDWLRAKTVHRLKAEDS